MKYSALVVVTALALATGFAGQVAAASLGGGYNVSALGPTCNANTGTTGQDSGSLDESSSGCSDQLTSGSFLVSGSGQANYDTVRASARVGFTDVDPLSFVGNGSVMASALGQASYLDMLTIDIAGRDGETVDLIFTTGISGDASATSDSSTLAKADALLRVRVNGQNVIVTRGANSQGDAVDSDTNPGIVQIVLGAAFSVSTELTVTAQLLASTTISGTATATGNAFANFGNSAGITSFELYETGSNVPITNWNLTSESGEFGFYTPTAVPVPASIWLFGSGIFGLIGIARHKKAA